MISQARKIKGVLLAVVLAATAAVSGPAGQASADGRAQLDASQIVADMGAGWNLGNQLEANANGVPSETAWGQPTITQALVDKVKAAGFRTIRIPVSYLRHIGAGPDYPINAAWLNRVQQVVDYAYQRGLYVLVNMHGDGYKTINGSWLICDAGNQAAIKAKYQKVWQQIATRFRNYDQHLILESMNEEFDGQYGRPTQPCYSNINAYNQIFVDTVRKTGGNNDSRWLLVPGWNTNIDYTTGNYGFVMPTDQFRSPSIPAAEKRLMLSVHYYDPWDFAGGESGTITQWGRNATNPAKKSSWGQEDHLDAQLKKVHDAFVAKGYPVVVGEYGSIDKTAYDSANNRYRADYARAVTATARKYGAATVYWDNGATGRFGFGLFNRRTYAVTQQGIIDAIMSGSGSRGTPASAAGAPNPIEKPGWILDRHDEFNGSLDSSLWVTNYLASRTPEWRSPARYHFKDGALVLRIDDDQPTYYAGNPMKVSSIQTGQRVGLHQTSPYDHDIPTIMKYAPQYGYFEIRAKSSARHGVHTAFWTVGRQDTYEQRAEIDVIEHAPGKHGLDSFFYNLHKWSDPALPEREQVIPAGFDVTADFHTYGLEWTPTQIKLYVDNVLKNTINAAPAYPSVFLLGIYENAGWNGTVNPADPQPKEFVVDYFRAYKKADIVSGATYKIKNVATGRYLDSEGNGGLTVATAGSYDDQDWVPTRTASGTWTIRNARTGRYYLDTGTGNRVFWNTGAVAAGAQWSLEPADGGMRVNNSASGRDYLYATAAGEVKWNTGGTDGSTVWAFERK